MFPRKLRIEVGLLLAVKIIALALIYHVYVAPDLKQPLDREAVRAHILAQQN